MLPAPQQCPTCGQPMELRELSCPACATVVRGRWTPSPFSRLSPEQQTFLRIFVRSRGNLSEVERTLGVSYPTVRAKLEEVIDLLGDTEPRAAAAPPAVSSPPSPPPAPAPTRAGDADSPREQLLARIARGEIGVEEGLAQLSTLSQGPSGGATANPRGEES